MKYATFNFAIHYEDGFTKNENTPYRGESIDNDSLVKFVQDYFGGIHPQPFKIEICGDINEYDDEKEWLDNVKDDKIFKGLHSINNFAGDLLLKYTPEYLEGEHNINRSY